jgi:hypothetical protein
VFALLQTTYDAVEKEAVLRAYEQVKGLTRYDGLNAIQHLPGFIGRHLPSEKASALKDALFQQGIITETVSENDLKLPPAHHFNQILVENDQIKLVDSLGKVFELKISEIQVISLACFTHQRIRSQEKLNLMASRQHDFIITEHVLESSEEQFVEFLTVARFPRIRLTSPFSKDLSVMSKESFVSALNEMGRYAKEAVKNRSLDQYLRGEKKILLHPDLSSYEQELVWLRFMASHKIGSSSAQDRESSTQPQLSKSFNSSALSQDIRETAIGTDRMYRAKFDLDRSESREKVDRLIAMVSSYWFWIFLSIFLGLMRGCLVEKLSH